MIILDDNLKQCQWRNKLEEIENLFINEALPDVSSYDTFNTLKIDRGCLFPEKRQIKYIQSSRLSDHRILTNQDSNKKFHTWNTLHHYSYNKSHDYLSEHIIEQKQVRTRGLIPEDIRYDNITQKVLGYLNSGDTKCFALQECEFYIYKSLVQRMNDSYVCRFIPHKIAYDKHGLYIESYGCAIFINKVISKNIDVFVQAAIKEKAKSLEMGYKYLAIKCDNDVFVSLHLPCFSGNKEKAWMEYFYYDFKNILTCFSNINTIYLLGDFNVNKMKLQRLLRRFDDEIIIECESCGVDHVMKVKLAKTENKINMILQ